MKRRRLVLAAAVLTVGLVASALRSRRPDPAAAWARQVTATWATARSVALAVREEPDGGLGHLGAEPLLTGFRPGRLSFQTLAGREARRVLCRCWEPAGATDGVTLYLPSSGVESETAMDLEALSVGRKFDPQRRVLVVPLPVAEQRGAPWPRLKGCDLATLEQISRQTALDLARAVAVAQSRGWRLETVTGFSLGGCLAATAVGAVPEPYAGADLVLWAAGGDLEVLGRRSAHPLRNAVARPLRLDVTAWLAAMRAIDPAAHLARARVAHVDLTAGLSDTVIPAECVERLQQACQRGGVPCQLHWVEGGHLAAFGAPPALERLLIW